MKVELIAYTPNPDGLANLCAGTCVSKTIPTMATSANGLRSLQEVLESRKSEDSDDSIYEPDFDIDD